MPPVRASVWSRVYFEAKNVYEGLTMQEMASNLYVSVDGQSPRIQHLWPDAFSVNLMQHFKHTDTDHIQRCVELVRRGDILLFHGWYNAAANEIIREIYERNHHPKWHSHRNAKDDRS